MGSQRVVVMGHQKEGMENLQIAITMGGLEYIASNVDLEYFT
jgi:hypothetical protein